MAHIFIWSFCKNEWVEMGSIPREEWYRTKDRLMEIYKVIDAIIW